MNAFATLPPEDRKVYITEAAARLGISPVLVEKDFWVCFILDRIFSTSEIAPHTVFKGGTSLSKVFNAIRRFSEDIDLQIAPAASHVDEESLWDEGMSRNELRRRIERLEIASINYLQSAFQPILENAIVSVLGDRPEGDTWLRYEFDHHTECPVLWFEYPSATSDQAGYVPKTVKLEPGSLADQRPVNRHTVKPLMASVLDESFDDFETTVVALELQRTFWEKATILHAEYHRAGTARRADRRSRHYSDFAALWDHPLRESALLDRTLLEAVVRNKKLFFPSAWANYDTATAPTFRLLPPAAHLDALAADYAAMRPMFFEDPPAFESLLARLAEAETRINEL